VAPAATPAAVAAGRYQIRRLVGEGGKKRVYLASDTRLERDVALALVKTEGLDEAGVARVHREARAMGRLGDHPHVVTVFDVGEENGRPYIVSQYMAGGSIEGLLEAAEDHRLPIADTLRLGIEVCRALDHAHGRGVIHRDVKPSNVWLTADGTAKLGDFGLALTRDPSRLTVEGMMVGTVAYMAPEQALGRQPDARSDLYSVGAMLYEMVAGRPPFLGDDALAIVSQHLNTVPVAPSWHNAHVPRALEALVLKLLAKTPDERPASAAVVRDALVAIAAAPDASVEAPLADANPLDRLAGGVFVGRAREMEDLRATLDDARAGRGRLVLLGGEPGIGKTRMASEIATYARVRGLQVLWGRCYETGGAPAYWPWVQIIRAYVHDRDPGTLLSEMGSGAVDIAQVVSEVRERLPDLPAGATLDPEQARFRLFDSIATFLRNAARHEPLVLVLDDLHWADKPSLLLLEFLAREMSAARLLVLVTYRDLALAREHPLFQTLGELTRSEVTRRFALSGLDEREVGRYIEMAAAVTPSPALVATIHRETEGNPFFVGEVVRLLAAEGGLERAAPILRIPQGVREVIGRRLAGLSPETNGVLSVASVIGREFELGILERVSDRDGDALLDALEEATGARVLAEVPGPAGRYRFAHALIRETLYDDLPATRRLRLHRRIGEVLETLHRAKPDRHLAELAYHFAQSAHRGDAGKAIDYARRAADRAQKQLAYEEAVRLYQMALDAVEAEERVDERLRGDLVLDLAEACRRAGETERARALFRQAADLARAAGAPEALARAALGYGVWWVVGLVDDFHVGLLEEALRALPGVDGALRARVMARLAAELSFSRFDERRDVLSRDAVEMARRVGDVATLAFALHARHLACWGPTDPEERLAVADEILRLADEAGDRDMEARGRHLRITDLIEIGDVRALDVELAAQARVADALRQPLYHWHKAYFAAMRALLDGRVEEGEGLAMQAFVLGQEKGIDAEQTLGVQMFSIRQAQARLEELEGGVQAYVTLYPAALGWRCGLARLLAELGRTEETRREFEVLAANDFADVPQDVLWLTNLCTIAVACAFLGDERRAATLYRLLEPYAGRNVVVGAGVAYANCVDYYLGLLAATTREWPAAEDHFDAALATNTRIGARAFLAETEERYAEMLLERAATGDVERALALLDRALEGARRLGTKAIVDRALAAKLRTHGLVDVDLETSVEVVASAVQSAPPNLQPFAAPDGTVTVLFTDIEGYSAMNERLGDLRAQAVLQAHGAIVREQVSAHSGLEVKSQGDGFMVVFSSARRAVLCAVAIQRALAGYSAQHPEEPIRVRIGLHTGEVIKDADDFFGKNVILAARITSAARGGEILVSSVLRELTESAGDLHFGDGRDVVLKGISGVRRVFEVHWAGTTAPETATATAPSGAHVFRCEGEYWTLAYEGSVCRLRDSKGMQHIAELLRHPGRPFEARLLATGPVAEALGRAAGGDVVIELDRRPEIDVGGLGDAGPMLDAAAKAAYKRRLDDLREELEEAERFNDPGRTEAARQEIDFLTAQLAGAVGLGGRDRKAASAAERARLTVTKRIKDALAKVRDGHPALGQYLGQRIKTGYLCVYTPDADHPVTWDT
jgi:class 3 adenylate cyclase